jgi:replicative DNA helicase
MNTQTFMDAWQRASDHVLSVLLAEEVVHGNVQKWERASLERGLNSRHFPPGQHRVAYLELDSMRSLGEAVHQSTILTRAGGKLEQSWLVTRIALYSELIDGQVFEKNLSDLLQMGEIAQVRKQLKEADASLENGGQLDSTVAGLMSDLAFTGVEVVKNETAGDSATELSNYLSQPPSKVISTGIGCLDGWMGGIGEDDVIGIAAPYKMRKSTLARNIALNVARNGGSVAILMYESNKRMVVAQFVTMFAVEFLINNSLYEAKGERSGSPLKWISSKDLVRVRSGYKYWDRAKVAAIDYGIAEYRKLEKNLRIYDKSKEGGSLYDLGSAQRVLLRDKRLYGADLAIIDHATQIMEGGSIYDRMSTIAPFLETFARRQNMALCILAQMNEETVKGQRASHSPGVKGGGDLPAAVDYFFTMSYREEDENGQRRDDVMKVTMHLSRYGMGGTDVNAELPIDPASGLSLEKYTRKVELVS